MVKEVSKFLTFIQQQVLNLFLAQRVAYKPVQQLIYKSPRRLLDVRKGVGHRPCFSFVVTAVEQPYTQAVSKPICQGRDCGSIAQGLGATHRIPKKLFDGVDLRCALSLGAISNEG